MQIDDDDDDQILQNAIRDNLKLCKQVIRVKKNSWGSGVPLNSNYLLTTSLCMFNSSDSWLCSIAAGVKDTSRCHRLLGFQEFQVSRPGSHSVKAPLPNCQNALLMLLIYITF